MTKRSGGRSVPVRASRRNGFKKEAEELRWQLHVAIREREKAACLDSQPFYFSARERNAPQIALAQIQAYLKEKATWKEDKHLIVESTLSRVVENGKTTYIPAYKFLHQYTVEYLRIVKRGKEVFSYIRKGQRTSQRGRKDHAKAATR